MIGYLIALGAAYLSWRTWRDSVRLAGLRKSLLADAKDALSDVEEAPLSSGYTRVTGMYRGYPALLEPVVDTLSVRKLPVLWLMVTVPAPVAVSGTFDLMMRAGGMEVYSRYHQLPHSIAPPPGFPEWSGVRTDTLGELPPVEVIGRHLQRFHDGDGKELLVTPKGLRMVVLLAQADRGGYLIFRDTRFETSSVTADFVRGILDELHALRSDLAKRHEEVQTVS